MYKRNWLTLDNTAKIIPSLTNALNTNVFRLSCTLKENVNAEVLQNALDDALKEFPLFLYTLKNGFFWHYLEKSRISPKVEEEIVPPCSRIDNGLLFRVSYYGKRINLEVYHVLSDGLGAMEFLKYIVSCYLSKKHNIFAPSAVNESSVYEKERDDFKKFERAHSRFHIVKNRRAYKMKFAKKKDISHDIIEVHIDLEYLKKAAKNFGTTITVYLSALLIESIIENMSIRDLTRPIGISIPIDLRSSFHSKTSRNFFYTKCMQYMSDGKDDVKKIIADLKPQFEQTLTKENLQKMLDNYTLVEKFLFIRIIPNFLKDLILKNVNKLVMRGETVSLSNIKAVEMPREYRRYIENFVALTSTNDLAIAIVSYENTVVMSFCSHFVNKEIERSMVKKLNSISKKKIKIVSNMKEEER